MTLTDLRGLTTEDIASEVDTSRLNKDSIETLFDLGANHFTELDSECLDQLLVALKVAILEDGNDAGRASVLGAQIALNTGRATTALAIAQLGLDTVGESETLEIWRDRAQQAEYAKWVSSEIAAGRIDDCLTGAKGEQVAQRQALLEMTAPSLATANVKAFCQWLELSLMEDVTPSISAVCHALNRAMAIIAETDPNASKTAETILSDSLAIGAKAASIGSGNATYTILRLQSLRLAEDWATIIDEVGDSFPDQLLSDEPSVLIMGWAAMWSLAHGGDGVTTPPLMEKEIVIAFQHAGTAIADKAIEQYIVKMIASNLQSALKLSIITITLAILSARDNGNTYRRVIEHLVPLSVLGSDDFLRGFELFLDARETRPLPKDSLEKNSPLPTRPLSFSDQMKGLEDAGYGAFGPWRSLLEPNLKQYVSTPETSLSVVENPGAVRFRRFVEPYANSSVLDLGCGTILLPEYLADFPKGQVAGIDPVAPELPRDFLFYHGVAEVLPWNDNTFDRVIIGTSGDHFLDPDLVLKEASRVMKSGGYLLYWTAFVQGAKPYDPWSLDNAPIDEFHLYHYDEVWFEERLYAHFMPHEKVRVDGHSVFYACRQKSSAYA